LTLTVFIYQAIRILRIQVPPRVQYPSGGFHSSTQVDEDFFNHDEKEVHERNLTEIHMPFCFNILSGMLKQKVSEINDASPDEKSESSPLTQEPPDELPPEVLDFNYEVHGNHHDQASQRARRVSLLEESHRLYPPCKQSLNLYP